MKSTSNVMGGPSGGGESSHQTTRKVSELDQSNNQKRLVHKIGWAEWWQIMSCKYWHIWLSVYSRVQLNKSSLIDASSRPAKIIWQARRLKVHKFPLPVQAVHCLIGPQIRRTTSVLSEPNNRLCKPHNTTLLELVNIQILLGQPMQRMQLFHLDRQTW